MKEQEPLQVRVLTGEDYIMIKAGKKRFAILKLGKEADDDYVIQVESVFDKTKVKPGEWLIDTNNMYHIHRDHSKYFIRVTIIRINAIGLDILHLLISEALKNRHLFS